MLTRRRFLTHSCSMGLAAATAGSTLLQLGFARQAAAQSADGYRALVCVLLAGGNDSFNMLVPDDDDQYGQYAAIRSDLALPRSDRLPVTQAAPGGRRYALHPGMTGLQELVNSGDAVLLANVGTLAEPFVPGLLDGPASRVPVGLFSHSDQINQWQTAIVSDRVARGWGGRAADLLQDANQANGVSMNISLSGTNVFQSGETLAEYSVDATGDGAAGINSYQDDTFFGAFRRRVIDDLLAVPQPHILRREYGRRLRAAVDAQQVFTGALQQAPDLTTTFEPDPFSQSLRQIARIISVRQLLGASRQTFFVTVGGWDHHDEVLNNQARMLPMVSAGLRQFRDALGELAVFDEVTTFTISDFARTLTSNGRGSDHGWGGHHIVMGGALQGGPFYGTYPELAPDSPLDVGRGVYAPTTSVDEYFAELALWFGVPRSDLTSVLPNVAEFYSPGSPDAPLGFLPV